MKKLLLLSLLLISLLSTSQNINNINIVPQPVEIKTQKKTTVFKFPFWIYYDKAGNNFFNAKYLRNELLKKNIPNAIMESGTGNNWESNIFLKINKPGTEEKYDLIISDKTITIYGSAKSIFYGIQTLLQILPTLSERESWNKISDAEKLKQFFKIGQLSITDYPRFLYRGMHLDVGRHFFSPSFIKK